MQAEVIFYSAGTKRLTLRHQKIAAEAKKLFGFENYVGLEIDAKNLTLGTAAGGQYQG